MGAVFGDRIHGWGGLPEHAMRRARLAAWLDVISPATAVRFFEETLALLRAREDEARRLWLATIDWLETDPAAPPRIGEWREAAEAQGLAEVAYVLRDDPPARRWGDDEAQTQPAHPDLNELTLGEKKARARRVEPRDLHKFHRETHPHVLEILFGHPAMTEDGLVRWLARRPLAPTVVEALFRMPRWLAAMPVQRALALNPWVPTRVGLRLAPLLGPDVLREIAVAEDLATVLRRWAAHLLILRG